MQKTSNIERLGDTLADRMKKSAAAAVSITAELGIINGDLSLTVDSIQRKIQIEDYAISLLLSHENYKYYNE